MPKGLFTLIACMVMLYCPAQKNYGVSQEYFIYENQRSTFVPTIYYQSTKGFYASFRYNYEQDGTASLQAGKSFSGKGSVSYTIIPLAGVLKGKYDGFSFGVQSEMTAGKFSFFTEPEYGLLVTALPERFFYNWSEVSLTLSGPLYSGIALQQGKSGSEPWYAEPGIMLGFTRKNFEIPIYLFKSPSSPAYFVAGVHWMLYK